MTYREAKYYVAEQLKNAGIENEVAESAFLLEFACGANLGFYLLHQMDEMQEDACKKYLEAAKQRCLHIPLQYLTGEQEFMGLTFRVNEHVLIPRQDTEILVETALDVLKKRNKSKCGGRKLKVLDLCTGSGCIAISLKTFIPEIEVTASDISEEALAVARENAAGLLDDSSAQLIDGKEILMHGQRKVEFVQSDLFSAIPGRFDMIVSNPPYIPSGVIPTLMPEVREHEPLPALDGSSDGLHFYREIIAESPNYLNEDGWLLFEIGAEQGEAVSKLMSQAGFDGIEVIPDMAGLNRVVKGHR